MKSRCFSFDEHILYMDGLLSQDLYWAHSKKVGHSLMIIEK